MAVAWTVLPKGIEVPLFFRWIKKTATTDLHAAKNGKLVYSEAGKTSKKCCWVYAEGAKYKGGRSIVRERTLVVFEFSAEDTAKIKNPANHIDHQSPGWIGEAHHPDKVIVKSNEGDAYGIGCGMLVTMLPLSVRLATKEEVAKGLGKSKLEIRDEQRWPQPAGKTYEPPTTVAAALPASMRPGRRKARV
jgi:hypothetical protein